MWVVYGGMPWCLSHCVCLSRIGGRDRADVLRIERPSGGGEDPRRARGRSEYSEQSKPLPPSPTTYHMYACASNRHYVRAMYLCMRSPILYVCMYAVTYGCAIVFDYAYFIYVHVCMQ